jgi:predicted nucleic acid-binding protein
MLYFDTSFLVPLIQPEATSENIAAFIDELDQEKLFISHWTRLEFSSLLAKDVCMGDTDSFTAAQADARFDALVNTAFSVILPGIDDFNLAKQYRGRFDPGLRAGDAFHLAIARNHDAQMIYSLDKRLVKAGTKLGLPFSMGIQTR